VGCIHVAQLEPTSGTTENVTFGGNRPLSADIASVPKHCQRSPGVTPHVARFSHTDMCWLLCLLEGATDQRIRNHRRAETYRSCCNMPVISISYHCSTIFPSPIR